MVAAPKLECLHSAIAIFAASSRESPAVWAEDGNLTHFQLDDLSTQLAVSMLQRGLIPRSNVPLPFEKSKYVVVALLATLKAGAACTTPESSVPIRRLEGMIEHLDPPFVVVSRLQRGRLNNDNEIITVDDDPSAKTITDISMLPSCRP